MDRRITAIAATAVLALAGCGSTTATTLVPGESGPTGTGDCGRVELGQGESTIAAGPLRCLQDGAEQGAPVSLVVVMPTTEGDPITSTYTVVGTGRVDVVIDSTEDTFAGSGAGITRRTCDLAVAGGVISLSGCTDPQPA